MGGDFSVPDRHHVVATLCFHGKFLVNGQIHHPKQLSVAGNLGPGGFLAAQGQKAQSQAQKRCQRQNGDPVLCLQNYHLNGCSIANSGEKRKKNSEKSS